MISKKTICARKVPITARPTTPPIALQLGAPPGSCASPSGSMSSAPKHIEDVAERAPGTGAGGEEGEEERRREHEPPEHRGGGRELVDGQLDEEIRRAPEGGEREQEDGIAPHQEAEASLRDRRSRRVPVPSATPPRISARLTNAETPNRSSRR